MRAKGKASVCVADILNRMQAEEPVNLSDVIFLCAVFLFKLEYQNNKQKLCLYCIQLKN